MSSTAYVHCGKKRWWNERKGRSVKNESEKVEEQMKTYLKAALTALKYPEGLNKERKRKSRN